MQFCDMHNFVSEATFLLINRLRKAKNLRLSGFLREHLIRTVSSAANDGCQSARWLDSDLGNSPEPVGGGGPIGKLTQFQCPSISVKLIRLFLEPISAWDGPVSNIQFSLSASPIHYQRDPVQTTKIWVHGAVNMLGLAKRVKAKILQASTSGVYGDPSVHSQSDWPVLTPSGLF